ncbi:MAG: hypothetical protein QOF26_3335 [Baekduia sp.]|jgi:hypothetical protein|nr:hypothetical protein [Baekduia sp.]MDX6703109.1 hypothetical protein [Baekduia sp.]
MPDPTPRNAVAPLLALAVIGLLAVVATRHASSAASSGRVVGHVSAAERAATFTFDPATAPADRTAVLTAVADARPEARRLIAAVDGLVDIQIATTAAGVVGTTQQRGDRFSMVLNLGGVSRRYGRRGIDRLVQHELGHVVDFALVPPALHQQLDAAIPLGYGCDQQMMGGCANTRERFAESFAKWASGDIGVDLYLGYKVPPPDDLANWGAPLVALAG